MVYNNLVNQTKSLILKDIYKKDLEENSRIFPNYNIERILLFSKNNIPHYRIARLLSRTNNSAIYINFINNTLDEYIDINNNQSKIVKNYANKIIDHLNKRKNTSYTSRFLLDILDVIKNSFKWILSKEVDVIEIDRMCDEISLINNEIKKINN